MPKRTKLHILIVCVALLSTLALVSSASGASFRVRASGERWMPDFKRIVKGDKIVWANPTSTEHDVSSYRFNSRSWSKNAYLSPGEQTSKRFWNVGTYKSTAARSTRSTTPTPATARACAAWSRFANAPSGEVV